MYIFRKFPQELCNLQCDCYYFKGPCDKFWKDYKKKIAANGNRITTKYLPECNKVNGYFSVKQCSLANGKYWCADAKTGRMIAGTRSETHCWRYDSSK